MGLKKIMFPTTNMYQKSKQCEVAGHAAAQKRKNHLAMA
jgi:hypothetical protein